MRAVKRALAVTALAAPLVIGCAGLASAQEGLDANFGEGQFVADQNGSGVADANSAVGADGLQHTDFWIWSDDTGISGAFAGSGATWQNG
ncbi:hypothetical protein [Kitasatospora sp. CB02891]|uniref:hypothetical protein n=1 Tax=Kitasatospora sp. CB02891 TaxID=2020329 RepID=UPI000C270621|nr:hypothetical protein [Kitasatospora sp. CB02891]PJN29279.1 hypothetical protein CG736_01595 [Kitasatospora sp. CB02891]